MEFDPGPSAAFGVLFDAVPDPGADRDAFWFDWGPIFYRGRLDGTARLLCIASDPGPTERVAGRTLVGDAGQRVQGLLTKIGLTRSYLCINAFAYALHPSSASAAGPVLRDPAQLQWRNSLFDKAKGPAVQAVIAFGGQAQDAVKLWPGRTAVRVFAVPHPSSRDEAALLTAWRDLVTELRPLITVDAGGSQQGPTYGAHFVEADYARIPPHDLPFGVPDWLGDDAWGRQAHPRHNNSVSRPA